ncbi:expressed unknown protein [Seminavis robusta]|uniref:Uncharacterized protein n=1 Tax=Seminavis robusta TaxID=568900 RepID=A0A9N8E7I2_9STRA|nr:expressed unknown protein [Seminavis robusta]|eukprot:Sro625_g177690.1 n/a (562) ;mRNA; f:51610-53295
MASLQVQAWVSRVMVQATTEKNARSSANGVADVSIVETVATWKAKGEPFGCEASTTTSIGPTATAFHANAHVEWKPLLNTSSPFVQLQIDFPAMNEHGNKSHTGGDEFVLILISWTHDGTAYKQAHPAMDLNSGTYRVLFAVPRQGVQQYTLELFHFYSCYQGLGPNKPGYNFSKVEWGPQKLTNAALDQLLKHHLPSSFLHNNQSKAINHHHHSTYFYSTHQPYCQNSQQGMDDYTNPATSLWVEHKNDYSNPYFITLNAKWSSVHCQPSSSFPHQPKPDNYEVLRIGDSTMPGKVLEIGDPFHHYVEFGRGFVMHSKWPTYLMEQLRNQTASLQQQQQQENNHHRVLLFSGGLHQLFQRNPYNQHEFTVVRGYNVPTVADLLTRMVCQLAIVHPNHKLLWVGVTPVQQHIYDKVDNTDHNILWLNALLRQRIVDEHQGKLASLCANVDVGNLWSIPDDRGNAHNKTFSRQVFQILQHNETAEEQEWANIDRPQKSVYGDRVVAFADIHDSLLARPECFKDKIHDIRKVGSIPNKPNLMATQHNVILDTLSRMRALMEEP